MVKMGNAALVWIIALFSVFIVGVVYIAMADPWNTLYDKFYGDMDSEYQPTAAKINTVWQYWPILMILGIILSAIVLMLRNEPDNGYYN